MNVLKLVFVLLFIWCSIYTVSVCVYNFRKHSFLIAVNAIILHVIATVLCVLYIFI